MTANCVDFIDEDNARGLFFRLLEHVPDPGSTHTHEHFHKVGTRDGEKRHLGFAGNGFCQQGFAGTRLPYH